MAKEELRQNAANLPGRKYMEDKPWDCAYCYWWAPGIQCCERKECYYLLPLEVGADQPIGEETEEGDIDNAVGNCGTCPYGRFSPCIGYCIAKLLQKEEKDEL